MLPDMHKLTKRIESDVFWSFFSSTITVTYFWRLRITFCVFYYSQTEEVEEPEGFRCPKCQIACPDYDTLNLHVNECLDQD